MKKILFLLAFVLTTSILKAQKNSETITKKVVKDGKNFYIETRTVKLEYTLIDFNVLFLVENDSLEQAQDNVLLEQFRYERLKLKEAREERNRLLRQSIKAGYVPEIQTPEQQKRVDAIRKRLGN